MEVIKVAKLQDVRLAQLSHQSSPTCLTPGVILDSSQPPGRLGSLFITPHHLIWTPTTPQASSSSPSDPPIDRSSQLPPDPSSSLIINRPGDLWISLSLLTAVEHLPRLRHPTLLVRLATFVFYSLSFSSPTELDDVWDTLKALISNRKPGDKESLYAFVQPAALASNNHPSDSPSSTSSLPGWGSYDPHTEFTRMKVIGDPSRGTEHNTWRLTSINQNFSFCSTYPSLLLIPSKISDTTLSYAVKYRSKGRLPIGTYVHWANGSSITRSSQPMVGFKNARSIQDEKLIEAIFHSHALHTGPVTIGDQVTQQLVYGATSSNLIIDARPTTNAMANTVKGAGTENMEYYKGCRKAYLGIDNIHVMRDSLNKVVSAIHESFVTGTAVSLDALKRSGWLKHIVAILEGTSLITRTVHVYNSHVLIHCSDGWDRTSQLSALSQVCLDPYYRTFTGFAILVEKDWLSFGHKFSDRSGIVLSGRERVTFGDSPNHSKYSSASPRDELEDSNSGSGAWVTSIQKQLNFGNSVGYSHAFKETSPVFHQFLDCVYQLQRQYPKRFEFNSSYLERLHEELYAGNYGTFLFDSEKERIEAKAAQLTCSVWNLFRPPNDISSYQNPDYDPSLDDPSDRLNTDQGILYPDVKDVVFWWEIFGCPNEEMNPPKTDPNSNAGFAHVELMSSQSDEIIESTDSLQKLALNKSALSSPRSSRATNGSQDISSNTWQPDSKSDPCATSSSSGDLISNSQTSYSDHQFATSSQLAGDQLQNAFQQAKIMGWSTWDRLKKGYEEVARSSISQSSPRPYQHSSPIGSLSHSSGNSHRASISRVQQQQYLAHSEPNPWSTSNPHPLSSSLKSCATPSRSPNDSHAHNVISLPINDPWQSSVGEPRITDLEPRARSLKPQSADSIPHDQTEITSSTDQARDVSSNNKTPIALKTSSTHPQEPSTLGCRIEQAEIDPLGVGFI